MSDKIIYCHSCEAPIIPECHGYIRKEDIRLDVRGTCIAIQSYCYEENGEIAVVSDEITEQIAQAIADNISELIEGE